MKSRLRQLLLCAALTAGCSESVPRASLKTASGSEPLDAWYGIFFEPIEGGMTDVELVLLFVEPAWSCGGDAAAPSVDAVSFVFPKLGQARVTSTVLSRSGPRFGATSGGSGEVRLQVVDDRYQSNGPTGPMVGDGGRLEGHIFYELGEGLLLEGDFRAPHCPLLDFRNAV